MTHHTEDQPVAGGPPTGTRAATRHIRALRFTAFATAAILGGIAANQVFGMGTAPAPGTPAVDAAPAPEGLKGIPVPTPSNLNDFVLDRGAAIRMGKALFWDMQLGSDGKTACASCHFQAGADNRSRNQVSPGLNRRSSPTTPNPDLTFQVGAPNYQFKADDFPFHKLSNPADRNSTVLRSHNDVSSSQGVFNGIFNSVTPGASADQWTPLNEGTFQVGGVQTRKVEPRNAPTVINAIFNFRNFWDGRAQYLFNGATPFGALDANARVFKNTGLLISSVTPVQVRIDNASLASLATGPALSDFEMSAAGRVWPHIGKRLLAAKPLAQQNVSNLDSVLGPWAVYNGRGLNIADYDTMMKQAFKPEWWNGTQAIQVNADGTRTVIAKPATLNANQFTQAQANFSLFFGLALQLYQATLVSDDSPFDKFMVGQTTALSTSQSAGLGLFFGKGKCANCHGGAEFTNASVRKVLQEPMSRMVMGNGGTAVYDEGFYNTAVSKTLEDIANGATNPVGRPMSLTALAQQVGATEFKNLIGISPNVTVAAGERIAVNGAFKTSTVRNIELTAPYFHNGGTLTLREIVEFYNRGGNHTTNNLADVDPDIVPLGLSNQEIDQLVDFMKALTDERVRNHAAPFDHPQLFIPNGHKGSTTSVTNAGNGTAVDDLIEIKAVGLTGYAQPDRPVDFRKSISPPIAGPGTGLLASYFSNLSMAGAPTLQRSEAVNLLWSNPLAAPVAGLSDQAFSVRWEGYVVIPTTGTYSFRTRSDDGVRLSLDGIKVIDNWTIHGTTENTSTSQSFTAGQRVKVVLEYFQNGGVYEMQLQWATPGNATFVPVPESALDPASIVTPVSTYAGRGLLGSYFSNATLTGTPVLQRVEGVDLNVTDGSPLPGVVPVDNFTVRWEGTLTAPSAGSYVFQTRADDGTRLWINGTLVVNDWNVWGGPVERNAPAIALTAGQQVTVKYEYRETYGWATASLRWQPPGASSFGIVPKSLMNPPAGY